MAYDGYLYGMVGKILLGVGNGLVSVRSEIFFYFFFFFAILPIYPHRGGLWRSHAAFISHLSLPLALLLYRLVGSSNQDLILLTDLINTLPCDFSSPLLSSPLLLLSFSYYNSVPATTLHHVIYTPHNPLIPFCHRVVLFLRSFVLSFYWCLWW